MFEPHSWKSPHVTTGNKSQLGKYCQWGWQQGFPSSCGYSHTAPLHSSRCCHGREQGAPLAVTHHSTASGGTRHTGLEMLWVKRASSGEHLGPTAMSLNFPAVGIPGATLGAIPQVLSPRKQNSVGPSLRLLQKSTPREPFLLLGLSFSPKVFQRGIYQDYSKEPTVENRQHWSQPHLGSNPSSRFL